MMANRGIKMLEKYSYLLILLTLFICMSLMSDAFFTTANLINVLRQSAMLLIMSLGMTCAMLLGRGVDMSLGAILSVSSCIAAQFLTASKGPETVALGIITALAIGASAGLINGLLIAYCGLPAILVTFGTREIFRGFIYFYMNGGVVTSLHSSILFLGSGKAFGVIPMPVVIAGILVVAVQIMLKRTRIGRELYIVGTNPKAARFSGIKVNRSVVIGFTLSGILASIAGIVYLGRLGAAEAEIGKEFAFQCVSAAAIGGVSFNGGVGTAWGAVVGALILNILINGMNLLHVPSTWQGTVNGIVIIAAVLLDHLVRGRRER